MSDGISHSRVARLGLHTWWGRFSRSGLDSRRPPDQAGSESQPHLGKLFRWLLRVGFCCGVLFSLGLTAAESGAKKSFDIPAGDAVRTLKQFSVQSGAQVIFPEDAIEGAKTNAVKGAFTPSEAIKRLLTGTHLVAAHDRESGSFAVTRIPDPPKETSRPNG